MQRSGSHLTQCDCDPQCSCQISFILHDCRDCALGSELRENTDNLCAVLYMKAFFVDTCFKYVLKKSPCHTHLFLCGDVEVTLTEVKEKILIDLLSHGVGTNLAVNICGSAQMYLDRQQEVTPSDTKFQLFPHPASHRLQKN